MFLSLFVCNTPTCIDFYNVSFFVAIGRFGWSCPGHAVAYQKGSLLALSFFYDFVDRLHGRVYFLFSRTFSTWLERHKECVAFRSTNSTCEWSGTWLELQMEDKLLPWAGADIFTYYVRSINWAIPTLLSSCNWGCHTSYNRRNILRVLHHFIWAYS